MENRTYIQIQRLLVALAMLLSIGNVYAYVPIVREGVEWGYVDVYKGSGENTYSFVYRRFQLCGDTVIEGYTYKKGYEYDGAAILDITKVDPTVFMREDEAGKVYRRKVLYSDNPITVIEWDWCDYREDTYLYDINNNSATVYPNYYSPLTFNIVDSCLVEGSWRKIYAMKWEEKAPSPAYFIEGMGIIDSGCEKFFGGVHVPRYMEPVSSISSNTSISSTSTVYGTRLLYERDLATGKLIYKSPSFDKFAAGDPTLSGVDKVGSDTPALSVSGRTVTADGAVIEAYGIDGRLVAKGTGQLTLPTAGVYILRIPGQAPAKVIVR